MYPRVAITKTPMLRAATRQPAMSGRLSLPLRNTRNLTTGKSAFDGPGGQSSIPKSPMGGSDIAKRNWYVSDLFAMKRCIAFALSHYMWIGQDLANTDVTLQACDWRWSRGAGRPRLLHGRAPQEGSDGAGREGGRARAQEAGGTCKERCRRAERQETRRDGRFSLGVMQVVV